MKQNRPKVILLNSATVDGRLAISAQRPLLYGEARWDEIEGHAGSVQPSLFEYLRWHYRPQANLEGSASFIPDGKSPEKLPSYKGDPRGLYHDYLPEEVVNKPGINGWFAAVDHRGRVRWTYKDGYPDPAWQGWHALIWVSESTSPDYLAYLQREQIPYLVAGVERVDLGLALEKMKRLLDVTCLLSTAGGRLNGALLRAGLVDEIYLELLPAVVGGQTAPSLFSGPDLSDDDLPVKLCLVSAQTHAGGRIWLHYQVADNNLSN